MAKISLDVLKQLLRGATQTRGETSASPRGIATTKDNELSPGRHDYDVDSMVRRKRIDTISTTVARNRPAVIVMSPLVSEDPRYAARLLRYAVQITQHSIQKNEAPMNSLLMLDGVLSNSNTLERDKALETTLSWVTCAKQVVLYVDYGISQAMEIVLRYAKQKGMRVEYRRIGQTVGDFLVGVDVVDF